MGKLKELIEEYDNLMRAGLDEVAVGDNELAEDYFSDAAYVVNKVDDENIKQQLISRYTVNPLDFAR